ncbi:MAG: hypothetical protein AAF713_02235 [Pseudomonadota bacterium]
MKRFATVAAAAALLTVSACGGYSTGQRAAIGAGAGAALGYGYSEFDRTVDPTATTLLGAAAGAAIGAVSGGPDDDRRRHRGWRYR